MYEMILKAYKYRIYPNAEQSVLIAKHFGSCRWLWNHTLQMKIEAYAKDKTHLSRFDLQKEIPELKQAEDTKWLKEVNSQSLQSVLEHQDKAFTKFFKEKKGFPKFKAKRNEQTFQCPQHYEVDFDNNLLWLPKFKSGIAAVFHRKFEGKIKTATIRQKASGKYYVSILVETPDEEKQTKKPDIKKAVGIDLGIKDFLVLSNGEKIPNPKHLTKAMMRLKRLQKRLSKKNKGSKNREKTRRLLAVQHEKIANKRSDFLHQITSKLVNEKQVDTFCIEDLNVSGMIKNHCLAQSIGDASWSEFVRMLEYKSKWNGKTVLKIGGFEPSSKTCSECGTIKRDLKLSDRTWICPSCGVNHDRDVNAANNILSFAFHPKICHEKIDNKIGQELPKGRFPSKPVENGVHLRKKVSCSTKQEATKL